MTDQELIAYLKLQGLDKDVAAAARIEKLLDRNKELTLQLLAVHGQAADALDKAVVAEAKLVKAEEERDGYLAERNKFQLYLQRTHADWELEVAAVDALTTKLTKAVEALQYANRMVRLDLLHMTDWDHKDFSQAVVDTGKRIATALAELEKPNDI